MDTGEMHITAVANMHHRTLRTLWPSWSREYLQQYQEAFLLNWHEDWHFCVL